MKEARDWSLNCDFIYRCNKICGCVLFICIYSLKSLQPVDRQLKCELIAIFLLPHISPSLDYFTVCFSLSALFFVFFLIRAFHLPCIFEFVRPNLR